MFPMAKTSNPVTPHNISSGQNERLSAAVSIGKPPSPSALLQHGLHFHCKPTGDITVNLTHRLNNGT